MILYNTSLRPYNSFHVDTTAAAFATFDSAASLQELLESNEAKPFLQEKMILGGGSNILFTKPYGGIILKNEIRGIELVQEDNDHYYIKAGGGEAWHQFVMHCVQSGWAGVENLSLIPGSVGAAPIQNIGAYGIEVKDVIHELQAFHLQDHCIESLSNDSCAFGYRESVFKKQYKGSFAILSVTFKLSKRAKLNTSYGAIEQELEQMGVHEPSIASVSQAVINIRRSKLPDPDTTGNAGSFFKNPLIASAQYALLKETYPDIPGFAAETGFTKVPAAWLIEKCGWKGYRKNDAGVHTMQPLVLVNYGEASGQEIFELSASIMQSVHARFGIWLEREVNIC